MNPFRWLDRWSRRWCTSRLWKAVARDRSKRGLTIPGGEGADVWKALKIMGENEAIRASRKTDPD